MIFALDGGWGGIRTHGTLAGTPVFKTGALNRSATHPRRYIKHLASKAGGTFHKLAPKPYHEFQGLASARLNASVRWTPIVRQPESLLKV